MKKIDEKILYQLRPSKLGGVGLFAIKDIPKGVQLTELTNGHSDTRFIPHSKANKNKHLKFLCGVYCVETDKGFVCPKDFNHMSVGWFVNHSEKPNVESKDGKHYFTAKKIKANQELTINYWTLGPGETAY